tara:strand:- start:7 stop:339 length:333 start_codon:yes stop_codon:yes gene_type:complete
MSKTTIKELEVNGETYVLKSSISQAQPTTSGRALVVIDRGWIYAGDIEEVDGRIRIHNALWVMRWDGVGIDGVVADPGNPKVKIRPMNCTVDLPADAELYRIPVKAGWGA